MGKRATAAAAVCALGLAACGGSTQPGTTVTIVREPAKKAVSTPTAATSTPTTTATTPPKPPAPKPPPPPSYPVLLPAAQGTALTRGLVPAMSWGGHTAAWIDRISSGLAVLAFDQDLVGLHLHSGTVDAGTAGWRYGPAIAGAELSRVVAAFNGGFRLSVGAGGFESYGRVAVPLQSGLASIVTYSDGTTDVGSWGHEVPAAGKHVVSVRQNLNLLIDHGVPNSTAGCDSCWGATLGGVADPARSAVGVTAGGRLIWVGGENVTVDGLVGALMGAHVVRAVELDINPEWVAGYLYGHRGGKGPVAAVPVIPAQNGIPGQFLIPWSRDFFSVSAR